MLKHFSGSHPAAESVLVSNPHVGSETAVCRMAPFVKETSTKGVDDAHAGYETAAYCFVSRCEDVILTRRVEAAGIE